MALLSNGFSNWTVDTFYAFAEPNRRKVVEILAHRGQLSATQISEEFDVTPQAISQHLKVLREAGVIRMERRAQQRLYTFNPQSAHQIEKWAAQMTRLWSSRFDAMEKALKDHDVSAKSGDIP